MFWQRLCAFSVCYINRSSPLKIKIKNSWASKSDLCRPMYSLVPFLSQQCSARDAYCALCSFHFALRHYSVLCNQRYFVELQMALYSMTVLDDRASNIFILALWICWLDDLERLLVKFLFYAFSRSVSFCFSRGGTVAQWPECSAYAEKR